MQPQSHTDTVEIVSAAVKMSDNAASKTDTVETVSAAVKMSDSAAQPITLEHTGQQIKEEACFLLL